MITIGSTSQLDKYTELSSFSPLVKSRPTFVPDTPFIGTGRYSRIAAVRGWIVSSDGVKKLIGALKLPNGTEEAMANAVAEMLDDFGLAERLVTVIRYDRHQ